MGAQESRNETGDESSAIQDYYSILEVTETATQDEIKKAFRRLALIHHPDKNVENPEAATKRFALIQQAYEVLSDEQERAWYDTHRSTLIPEPDAEEVFEQVKSGTKRKPRPRERGLTVRHLTKFFDPTSWSGFDDSESGFHALFRNLFARIAEEEMTWDATVHYPSFGYPHWSYNPPKGDQNSARLYYNTWLSFSTSKDFSWLDQYDLPDAPDRRIRRLMEKENKKCRDDGKREYNDTIRSLVLFIRKRDPRFKIHQSQTSQNTQPQPSSSEPTATAQAHQRRRNAGQTYVEQDWQRVPEDKPDRDHLEAEEVLEGEEWECIACDRTFRSEASWKSHERSKKHLRQVERLQREMHEENDILDDSEAKDNFDLHVQLDELSV